MVERNNEETMKFIISGATSCIGAAVVKELLIKDSFVYAVIRQGSSREKFLMSQIPQGKGQNLKVVYCDFANYANLVNEIEQADIFVNFAWVGTLRHERNSHDIQMKNVEYALNAMRVAKKIGCRIYSEAGSQAEYGWEDGLITENSPCKPYSEYGKAKYKTWLDGGRLAEELGISYVHLRIFSVFGAGKLNDMISESVEKISRNEKLDFTKGTQLWNMMNHTDAAVMICNLLTKTFEKNSQIIEAYNIASNDTRPLRDFINEMCSVLNYHQSPNFGAISAEKLLSLNPSIEKVLSVIGEMRFHSFADSILNHYKYMTHSNLQGGKQTPLKPDNDLGIL